MSVDFEQLRDRANPWMAPIPGVIPDAASARLEAPYQTVTNEVAKLDRPDGGNVDWKKVAELSEDLLRTRTKDLLIGSYLAHALHRLRGLDGLATGATLLAEMLDRFWESLQPEVRRLRARVNALQWFLDKTSLVLPEQDFAAAELPAIEALQAAFLRLAELARARFADATPAISPLLERIERMRVSASPPPESEAPVGTPATGASTTIAAAPAGELAAANEAGEFLRNVGASLISAAHVLRHADAANPDAYRLLRTGMWLHLSSPPPSAGGKTQVPPPPAALRSQLAALAQNQKWAALLEETESAAPLHRFALDLHRLSWQALAGLGSSQDRARAALVAEMRALLARMPQLPGLAFADGTPFAEPQTRTWISSEIELSPEGTGPRPQRGNGGEGAEARLAQARKLLDATQATQALALLQEAVTAARAGRDRFLARLDLARVAAGAGFPAVAKAVYEELDREASAHDLDAWEPELVSAYLKGLIAAARALSNDPRGAAFDLKVPYNRLCRLDPAAAHEVWP